MANDVVPGAYMRWLTLAAVHTALTLVAVLCCPANSTAPVASDTAVVFADCAAPVFVVCSPTAVNATHRRWANVSIAIVNSTVGAIACGGSGTDNMTTAVSDVTVLLSGCRLAAANASLSVVSLGSADGGGSAFYGDGIAVRIVGTNLSQSYSSGAAAAVRFSSFAALSGVDVAVVNSSVATLGNATASVVAVASVAALENVTVWLWGSRVTANATLPPGGGAR